MLWFNQTIINSFEKIESLVLFFLMNEKRLKDKMLMYSKRTFTNSRDDGYVINGNVTRVACTSDSFELYLKHKWIGLTKNPAMV